MKKIILIYFKTALVPLWLNCLLSVFNFCYPLSRRSVRFLEEISFVQHSWFEISTKSIFDTSDQLQIHYFCLILPI